MCYSVQINQHYCYYRYLNHQPLHCRQKNQLHGFMGFIFLIRLEFEELEKHYDHHKYVLPFQCRFVWQKLVKQTFEILGGDYLAAMVLMHLPRWSFCQYWWIGWWVVVELEGCTNLLLLQCLMIDDWNFLFCKQRKNS